MQRQSRWSIRIGFLLVIVMGAFGLWYGTTFWLPAAEAIDIAGYTEGIDWIEAIAAAGEQAIQLLLGATSGS